MSQKRKFRENRVSRRAFKSQRIALEKEGFSFSQAQNLFKKSQAGQIPSQDVYKEDVFKYGGDIEDDYNAPGRLSESIRNPSSEPDDYEKILKLVPRDMFKASVLESNKQMSDFYIKNRLREVGPDGKVSYVDKDGDGEDDEGVSMEHPVLAVSRASLNGARMLKQAEGNFLSSINQFKQPRFEYRNDSQFRLASDDRKRNGDLGDLGDDAERGGHNGGDDLEHCDVGSETSSTPLLPPIFPAEAEGKYNSHGPDQRPPPPPASANIHGSDVNTFTGTGVKEDVKHRERVISDLTNVAGSGPPVPFGPVGSPPHADAQGNVIHRADAHGNVRTAQIRKTELDEVGLHRNNTGGVGVADQIASSAPSTPARAVKHSDDPHALARILADGDNPSTGTVASDTPRDSGESAGDTSLANNLRALMGIEPIDSGESVGDTSFNSEIVANDFRVLLGMSPKDMKTPEEEKTVAFGRTTPKQLGRKNVATNNPSSKVSRSGRNLNKGAAEKREFGRELSSKERMSLRRYVTTTKNAQKRGGATQEAVDDLTPHFRQWWWKEQEDKRRWG